MLHLGACPGFSRPLNAMAKNLRSGKTRVQEIERGCRDSSSSLLGSIQEEVQRLQKENEELLASLERDRRISLGGRGEAEQLLEEHRRIQEDLQAELTESREQSCVLEERCTQLEDQLTRMLEEAELERLRAVDELCRKYNDCEGRLLQQLQKLQEGFLRLQSRTCAVSVGEGDTGAAKRTANPICGGVGAPSTCEVSSVGTPVSACSTRGNPVGFNTSTPKSTQPEGNVVDAPRDLSTATLAQQLPPLPNFSGGESPSEDSFLDWIGQFELMAEFYRWSKQAKLIHLSTRLRGEAFQFYRSCSKQQKADYDLLVAELRHRFTPVRIPSVQTSLFHERKQGEKESVDSYAQSLKTLFRKAYPQVQQGGEVAESIGKSVLVSRFVAGLLPTLKIKVAGVDGKFDEILVKARFEEAKLRELSAMSTTKSERQLSQSSASTKAIQPSAKPFECTKCGGTNHSARYCRMKGRFEPREARGASQPGAQATQSRVGTITEERKPSGDSTREAEISAALGDAMTTMHTVTTSQSDAHLGPTLTAEVSLEGVPVKALVDTGSPSTIVSLKCLIDSLAKQKKSDESPAEWRKRIEKRLEPPGARLKSYSG